MAALTITLSCPALPKTHHFLSSLVSPTNQHLAAASWDGMVCLYDISNTGSIGGVPCISVDAPLFDCDFSKDGALVAGVGADAKVHVVDITSGQTTVWDAHSTTVRSGLVATISCCERVYSMDTGGNLLAIALAGNLVDCVNLDNPRLIAHTVQSPILPATQTRAIACAADGSHWSVSSIGGRVVVQALRESDRGINTSFQCHTKPSTAATAQSNIFAVNAVSFLPPNKNVLATGGGDGTFFFWQVGGSNEHLARFSVGSAVTSVIFSPSGRWLAYAVGYDWSRGHRYAPSDYPLALALHPALPREVRTRLAPVGRSS
ncbi:WD40-repeat-containing domain protein [Lasiosphaeria hispida]|uniref:WD40-repeat-containing domain protein n=1 Tax=Lasiosphaeria hispida TaxID=260671 RepID=A0AAJ0HMS9_9PEZI|nr:WD40-repeat-containing domain protein [Lasiosphaeria hispida]